MVEEESVLPATILRHPSTGSGNTQGYNDTMLGQVAFAWQLLRIIFTNSFPHPEICLCLHFKLSFALPHLHISSCSLFHSSTALESNLLPISFLNLNYSGVYPLALVLTSHFKTSVESSLSTPVHGM